MRPTHLLASLIACAALLTACGSAAPTATTAPPAIKPAAAAQAAPTTPPPATVTTVPGPVGPESPPPAATKPAAGATTSAAAAATTAPAAIRPAAAATGAQTWTLASDKTQVTLKVNERLADRPTNSDAVLNTKAVSGQIVLTPDGKVQEGSKLTVDLNTLQSDSGTRDRFIKGNVLEVRKFPNAEFTPTELRGVPTPLPTSGEFTAQLVGTMKIRETSRPVTFDLTGRIEGNTVTGTATSQLKITDFGMTLPRVPVLLSMEDLGRLEIAYTATT